MASNLGFGTPRHAQKKEKVAKSAEKRQAAASQYDKMKSDGMPEFVVFVRVRGKKNWFPVGSIAVGRSNQINQAIFANEDELLKGAFRLSPHLRKHKDDLEYGYRLKEFPDEPVQLAEKPAPGAAGALQSAFSQVRDRFTSLLKRG
jgi:hypothetical protein